MTYDYVFITHLPAFYKVNLYQEIARHSKIFVIFIASTSVIRTPDFVAKIFPFDHCFLNQTAFEQRSRFKSLLAAFGYLRKLSYRKLVVGGWDLIEFWLMVLGSPKQKNALALESSCYESRQQGFRAWLKKIFLRRINLVFCSGQPHQTLLQQLGFTGKSCKTLGVGIFNYQPRIQKSRVFSGKFLYVGRLAPEKNLLLLLQAFQHFPHYTLTLIGQGPLKTQLEQDLPANVKMVGHVANETLADWYQQHDGFILPSQAEPWGLVVEEALYYGLPIIASCQVGCAIDLVQAYQVGVLFDPFDVISLQKAIVQFVERYEQLANHTQRLDFKARDHFQVQQYLEPCYESSHCS